MKPTKAKIEAELKKLRHIVENSGDLIEVRIAYSMEQAIRWATEETVGWNKPHKDTSLAAEILKDEIRHSGKALNEIIGL